MLAIIQQLLKKADRYSNCVVMATVLLWKLITMALRQLINRWLYLSEALKLVCKVCNDLMGY